MATDRSWFKRSVKRSAEDVKALPPWLRSPSNRVDPPSIGPSLPPHPPSGRTKTGRGRATPRPRPDRFVVGFLRRGETVYGKIKLSVGWTDPMTLKQARARLQDLASDIDRAIFELVPVVIVKRDP